MIDNNNFKILFTIMIFSPIVLISNTLTDDILLNDILQNMQKDNKIIETISLKKISNDKAFSQFLKIKKYTNDSKSIQYKAKKRNSQVLNIQNGKVIYAKYHDLENKNVIIIQHKDEMYSKFSNVDKITQSIMVNKWVRKGYILGTDSNNIKLQVIRNKKYINPRIILK